MMTFILILSLISETPISLSTALLMIITIRVSLALLVSHQAKRRQLDCGSLWALFTLIFGLIFAVLFFILNKKLGINNMSSYDKKYDKKLLIICAVAIAVTGLCFPVYNYEYKENIKNESFDSLSHMPYLDEEKNKYFCYDKMGNEYSGDEEDEMVYYTPDGIKLIEDYYVINGEENICYANETEGIRIPMENAFINEDGFLIEKDINKLKETEINTENDSYEEYMNICVYSDSKGNLYFEPLDCSWDKNGNLVFRNENITDYVKNHK